VGVLGVREGCQHRDTFVGEVPSITPVLQQDCWRERLHSV